MGGDETEQPADVLSQLYEATTQLYASTSVEECTRLTAAAAIDILGFDWCVLMEANQTESQFEVVATAGDTGLERGDQPLAIGEGIVGQVYESGTPDIMHDAGEESGRIRSSLTIPVGNWGVFQGLSTDPSMFDDEARRLSELFITPLATTIERIQTEQQLRSQKHRLQRKNAQIESIHTISTEMKAATCRDTVYELVITAVEEILDIGICTITEHEDGYLRTKAVGSDMSMDDYYAELPVENGETAAAETFRDKETLLFTDLDDAKYEAANSTYQSVMSVPLGEWGVFQAATTEKEAFDHTDRRLIELLANAAEAAVDRLDREQELEQRADELEQRNERLDQFAGRLSHELRNPLSVLESRTWLARESGDDEHFEHIERAISRMDRLIDDTLTLARYGEIELSPEPVSLAAVAEDCWSELRTLKTEIQIETEATVEADPDRLRQLLSNLFQNAIEHAGGDVIVTVGETDDGFYVEDDGVGIPSADRDTALEAGETDLSHGTGLGLAVVSTVAEDHGWGLSLTESESGGARFEFSSVPKDAATQDGEQSQHNQ